MDILKIETREDLRAAIERLSEIWIAPRGSANWAEKAMLMNAIEAAERRLFRPLDDEEPDQSTLGFDERPDGTLSLIELCEMKDEADESRLRRLRERFQAIFRRGR